MAQRARKQSKRVDIHSSTVGSAIRLLNDQASKHICAKPHDFVTENWMKLTDQLAQFIESMRQFNMKIRDETNFNYEEVLRFLNETERKAQLLIRQHHQLLKDIWSLKTSSVLWVCHEDIMRLLSVHMIPERPNIESPCRPRLSRPSCVTPSCSR